LIIRRPVTSEFFRWYFRVSFRQDLWASFRRGFLVRLTNMNDCYPIGALGVLFLSFSDLRFL
ncbi:unnamed protein product, partial [Brassica oleracea var. botrytis]